MELAGDEEIIAQYYFENKQDENSMAVLTIRRLVIVYRNEEQSYPLSKITAVKVAEEKSSGMAAGGVILAIIGLGMISSYSATGPIVFGIGGALVYFAWKGKTRLVISHMGGQQDYAVSGQDDPKLKNFINALNSKLA